MPRLTTRELQHLARRFVRGREQFWNHELKYYTEINSLAEAIFAACGLRLGDRIPDHQRRVGRAALRVACGHLLRNKRALARARDFKELHNVVADLSKRVPRFGKLATYDIAWRLGVYLKKEPAVVYLHAGTREGAAALGISGDTAEIEVFPKALQVMSPSQLEDFLCICKAALLGAISYRTACKELKYSCAYGGSGC